MRELPGPSAHGAAKVIACAECGMVLRDGGELHPLAFCVLKKAGMDPWREVTQVLDWLGRSAGLPIEHAPLLRDLPIPFPRFDDA